MEYKILAYYSVGGLDDPQKEIALHKKFLQERDFTGRIYISEQGINGQSSGRADHADEYIHWIKERFQKMSFKVHLSKEHPFAKMTVKYRKQLVAVDCDVDFSKVGEHVSPEVWKKMLEEKDEETLLLDVRNDYEWKIGRFEGAELPKLETFRQFPDYAKRLKNDRDPQKTRVLMYCTGGIRCEYFSALMKQEGFESVYQLEGGIINYGLKEGSEHWEGKLFVFDDRLGVPMGEAPISNCCYCNTPNDVYFNCANMDCNQLFLCCSNCLKAHKGCCCSDCETAPRVRPYQENAKPFRKWSHAEKLAWKDAQIST